MFNNPKENQKQMKGYKGVGMDWMAKWYAKSTRTNLGYFKKLARKVVQNLPENSKVLEVAPGPGYLAVEIAKLGNYQVTGLDISKAMVEIAQNYAIQEGTTATFLQGNASNMPFENESFDFIVCSAAFKNFSDPVGAIQEMYRVLKPGGKALIVDLRKDAPNQTIFEYVDSSMKELSIIDRLFTKWTLVWLKKRAYTKKDIEDLVSKTSFEKCEILDASVGIGVEIWLKKSTIIGYNIQVA